ncbi:MAG: AIPR family protein [Candidatus Acidiferrales bacterium]
MSALDQAHFAMLQKALDTDFVPHLLPLLDQTRPPDEQKRKNYSRAFGAFALSNVCSISATDAAGSVVDDFDDFGVDAIYYHAPTETLYLVQSKLKAGEQFSQEEALAFSQGVRKLIKQDFTGFNTNVQNRKSEIELALDNCSHIRLVVAHTGAGVSQHATQAFDELFADPDDEERLEPPFIDYDAAKVVADLLSAKAYEKVNVELKLYKCTSVSQPRITYFGLALVTDLVDLHEKYGKALYEKNIRTFLGHKTEVNSAIQKTLADQPESFLYLNNGVTALCEIVEPKGSKSDRKKLKVRGLSVINGAQTIASSARFVADNAARDISSARVSFTLIKSDTNASFGKQVTRARNHQNPVLFSDFAALDDEQERLRRELAYLGIHYAFKPGMHDHTASGASHIRIDEAAQALAMFQPDPRYIVWLKKEPAQLLDTTSTQYKALFISGLTPFQVANAVRFNRYVVKRMNDEAEHAAGPERLAYRHGAFAAAWVLAKRVRNAAVAPVLIDEKKLQAQLSVPFDQLRQTQWNLTKAVGKGPLALFRNQTDVTPLVEKVAIEHYALGTDPVVGHKQKQQKPGEPYPEDLFAYLASKAPQIGNLS